MLLALSVAALVSLILVLWIVAGLWWEAPPDEKLKLPRLVIPVQVGPGPEEVAPSAPAPLIQLSKFRVTVRGGGRMARAPRRRSIQPAAVLPRTREPGCEICKGVALVWSKDPNEPSWNGICRRCGLPFASVPHEGWQEPVARPLPSII